MGNKASQHTAEFIDGPLKYTYSHNKKYTDDDIDIVIKDLKKGLKLFGNIAKAVGLNVDLRGNDFSESSIQQVRDVLYNHGFVMEKFTILYDK